MHGNHQYTEEYKQRFNDRVKQEFGLNLPTIEEEIADETVARIRIVEVMALVRKNLEKQQLSSAAQHRVRRNAKPTAALAWRAALHNTRSTSRYSKQFAVCLRFCSRSLLYHNE